MRKDHPRFAAFDGAIFSVGNRPYVKDGVYLWLTNERELEKIGCEKITQEDDVAWAYPDYVVVGNQLTSRHPQSSMQKQTFIEMFEKAQNFFKQQHELGQMLHKTLLNGGSVVSFGGELLEGYVKLLAEQSGISQDSIEWLLYEGGGRCFKDKVSYSVITAEDLWEFEKEVMNDNDPKM